jgi:hypothetical protein
VKTVHELRCFCARAPLLAMYGIDERGALYVHVRVFKQKRIYGEVLIKEGTVQIHCRECLRWNTVKISHRGSVSLEEGPEPEVIDDY